MLYHGGLKQMPEVGGGGLSMQVHEEKEEKNVTFWKLGLKAAC